MRCWTTTPPRLDNPVPPGGASRPHPIQHPRPTVPHGSFGDQPPDGSPLYTPARPICPGAVGTSPTKSASFHNPQGIDQGGPARGRPASRKELAGRKPRSYPRVAGPAGDEAGGPPANAGPAPNGSSNGVAELFEHTATSVVFGAHPDHRGPQTGRTHRVSGRGPGPCLRGAGAPSCGRGPTACFDHPAGPSPRTHRAPSQSWPGWRPARCAASRNLGKVPGQSLALLRPQPGEKGADLFLTTKAVASRLPMRWSGATRRLLKNPQDAEGHFTTRVRTQAAIKGARPGVGPTNEINMLRTRSETISQPYTKKREHEPPKQRQLPCYKSRKKSLYFLGGLSGPAVPSPCSKHTAPWPGAVGVNSA